MSDRGTCRMPGCDNESRSRGDLEYEYEDGDKASRVSTFGAKFCSLEHELKYEHIKADAEDAKRVEEERGIDKRNFPEYDGPPY